MMVRVESGSIELSECTLVEVDVIILLVFHGTIHKWLRNQTICQGNTYSNKTNIHSTHNITNDVRLWFTHNSCLQYSKDIKSSLHFHWCLRLVRNAVITHNENIIVGIVVPLTRKSVVMQGCVVQNILQVPQITTFLTVQQRIS